VKMVTVDGRVGVEYEGVENNVATVVALASFLELTSGKTGPVTAVWSSATVQALRYAAEKTLRSLVWGSGEDAKPNLFSEQIRRLSNETVTAGSGVVPVQEFFLKSEFGKLPPSLRESAKKVPTRRVKRKKKS